MSLSILPMEPEQHRGSLLALWKENLLNYSEARFDWLYRENPAGPARTFVAVNTPGNEVVGCGSLLPRKICVNGEECLLGIAIDFVVQKRYRVFGPALKIQRAVAGCADEGPYDLLVAFPNQASQGVFLRAGFKILGSPRNCVKIVRTEKKLSMYIGNSLLLKIISAFADHSTYLLDRAQLRSLRSDIRSEKCDTFDERFERLWKEKITSFSIFGEHNSEFLKWRYASCDGYRNKAFCLTDTTGTQLFSYLIYTFENNAAQIIDMFSVEDRSLLKLLLLRFSEQMRTENVDAISLTCLGPDTFLESISKLRFVERPLNRPVLILFGKKCPDALRDVLENKDNWFLLDGEMDI